MDKNSDKESPQAVFISKLRFKTTRQDLESYYNEHKSEISLIQPDIDKILPLQTAISAKNYDAVDFLIKNFDNKDKNINLSNSLGWTALHTSCTLTNTEEITALLIHNGADVNFLNKKKQTPLHLACGKNRAENVKVLLSSTKIELNLQDDLGFTPFIKACASQAYEVIPILLNEPQIKLNIKDNQGNTAIFYLIEDKEFKLAIEVIKKGADIKITNKDNKAPLDLIEDKAIKDLIIKSIPSIKEE